MNTKTPLIGVAAITLLAMTSAAPATVITVGTPVTFNFDFFAAGVSPTPPYQAIELVFGTDISTVFNDGEVDSGTIAVFDGLDGTGDALSGGFWNDASASATAWEPNPKLADGIFSMVFTASAGSIVVNTPYAIATNIPTTTIPRLDIATVYGVSTSAVPEPATAALLGLGVVAMGMTLRRRKDRP